MVKELLVCQMCQKPWKRIKSRGRKPRFCAKCFAEALMEIEQDILPEEPKFKQDRAKIVHWVCPACNKGLTTYVAVSQAPTDNTHLGSAICSYTCLSIGANFFEIVPATISKSACRGENDMRSIPNRARS